MLVSIVASASITRADRWGTSPVQPFGSGLRCGLPSSTLTWLNSDDLLANGAGELRQIIVMQGAIGDVAPVFLRYEPFYRAIMGLAVGFWDLRARA